MGDGGGGALVTRSYLTFVTPWTVACQTPLSMGFPRQEHWSRLPFPPPGDIPNPGIKPWSLALQADSLFFFFFNLFIYFNWRLITLQYRSGFCHVLT